MRDDIHILSVQGDGGKRRSRVTCRRFARRRDADLPTLFFNALVISRCFQCNCDVFIGTIAPEPAMIAIECRCKFAGIAGNLQALAVTVIGILRAVQGITVRIEIDWAATGLP